MKVERQDEEFKPIVITLETRDEAECMWHMLNVADRSLSDAGYTPPLVDGLSLSYRIWERFSVVFNPNR